MHRNASVVLCSLVLATVFSGATPTHAQAQQSAPEPATTPTTPAQQSQAPAATSQPQSSAQEATQPHPALPPPPPVRAKAALHDYSWKFLKDGAASDKLRDRSDAISALAVLDNDREAMSVIANALKDKEVSIRVLAATSLGDVKARSTIPQLKEALDDESAEVSFAAAQSLWKMGDHRGRDILYAVLSGERKVKPGVVQSKMNKMREDIHDPKALALIGINEASGALLGPFSMGISFIEEYAKNSGAPIQALCASLLSSDNSRDTFTQLEDALADKNWAVRAAAARALAKMNRPEVMGDLRDMMQYDKEQPARFAAAAAIVRLTPVAAKASSPASSPQKPPPPAGSPASKN